MIDHSEYEVTLSYKADVEAKTVSEGEFALLRAFLPEALRELMLLQEEE